MAIRSKRRSTCRPGRKEIGSRPQRHRWTSYFPCVRPVSDGYFADPELWVAILVGAGDRAFSAGNDLVRSASGRPVTVPLNGFAGLTNRRDLPKPVIAAVNS